MSPPKVNLATKQPLTTETEKSVEKGDGLSFPAVISVETDRRAHLYRRQARRQRYQRLICGVALIIVVAVATLGTMAMVHRLRMRHRKNWECLYGRQRLPETVSVDHEAKVIVAEHDHDKDSQTTALRIIHAYRRGLVAYKDVDNNICYIDRLDETFEEGYDRFAGYENDIHPDGKNLMVISKPIEVEVLRHIADIHIFEHCENGESVWVKEIDMRQETDDVRVMRV